MNKKTYDMLRDYIRIDIDTIARSNTFNLYNYLISSILKSTLYSEKLFNNSDYLLIKEFDFTFLNSENKNSIDIFSNMKEEDIDIINISISSDNLKRMYEASDTFGLIQISKNNYPISLKYLYSLAVNDIYFNMNIGFDGYKTSPIIKFMVNRSVLYELRKSLKNNDSYADYVLKRKRNVK